MRNNLYGLSYSELKILFKILRLHTDSLRSVKLFGSRARNDYKRTSDLDLAISGRKMVCSELASDFEQSLLPYTVDIVDYDSNISEILRQNIDRDGKTIFWVEGGVALVTVEQLKEKFFTYDKALEKLRLALAKDSTIDDMYVDATVQRFEFCFELAWKLLKSILKYEGIEVNSPRASIREGFKDGIILDAANWLDMLEKRNLSSHTYDENTALEIYAAVQNTYFALLVSLKNETEQRIFSCFK